ncbi:MAG: DNA topoisomerase, partial [Desulfomonilia bacterium]
DTLKQEVIPQSADQFAVVKTLLNRPDVDSVIIATDAGREGELVARWIMKMAGYEGEAKRLWISSQTDSAISEGFANLKDAALYDNLYSAAESRAAADWYVGMNVTRALTCHYDAKLSAGRVQTPTLALMTLREDEIESFSGQFYWTLKADFGSFSASHYTEEDTIRIKSEATAKALETSLVGKKGLITSLETVEKSEQPPLAYDLTELQRDANIHLNFSAKETLDTLQGLYEQHKIVTYPRTDSRYITSDIVATIPQRLHSLSLTPFASLASSFVQDGFRIDEQRFVQDLQVTDHHALIPTEQKVDLTKLTKNERSLWELIVMRFLEVLSPDYLYRTTTLVAEVEGSRFQSRLTIPTQQGWRDVARLIGRRSAEALADDDEPFNASLLSLKEGSEVTVGSVKIRRMTTTAPSRYTEATLLSAMEHAGRLVEDANLKKRLGNGLGTPATRADIIEKLIRNHYVDRQGRELVPTAKGREVVRLAPDLLCSAHLTGKWEERLSRIAEGKEDSTRFLEDIKNTTRDLVQQVISSGETYAPQFKESKACPHCKAPMMKVVDEIGQDHYICQRLSCSYEEKEIKKRVHTPAPEETPVVVKVTPKAKEGVAPTPKKRVVVKKALPKKGAMQGFSLPDDHPLPPKKGTYTWETVIEVVRPSKFTYRNDHDRPRVAAKREDRPWGNSGSPTAVVNETPTGGGTFADFMKASEERKKRDRKKKR